MMNMEEASQVHVKWTPRGWMEREPELLRFEQHLYLRQPGYGTCYITGKYLVEDLIMEYAEKLETDQKNFILKDFLNKFNIFYFILFRPTRRIYFNAVINTFA